MTKKTENKLAAQANQEETLESEFQFDEKRWQQIPRRHLAAPGSAKVKVTLLLDLDILKFFKQRAADPNAAPYQTQINLVLRQFMTSASTETAAPADYSRLLNDAGFIEAVAQQVHNLATKT